MASVLMSVSLFAQQSDCIKEIGFSFSNMDNFGATFKFGKEKSPWKIGIFSLSDTWAKQKTINLDGLELMNLNQNSKGFNIQLGKEFRNKIIDNVYFTCGPDYVLDNYSIKYNYQVNSISEYERDLNIKYYVHELRFNIGFTYKYKDKLKKTDLFMNYFH